MGTPDALLHCFMDLGEAMLTVGADVNRVEDTLIRMGMAYGAARMNVFVITSSMVVTMTLPDGRDVTQTRRVPSPGGTDMTVLEDLNALSRRCCACLLPAERLTAEIKALTQGGVRPLWAYCGSMLAAGSCTLSAAHRQTDFPPRCLALPSAICSGIFPRPAPTAWCSICCPLWRWA